MGALGGTQTSFSTEGRRILSRHANALPNSCSACSTYACPLWSGTYNALVVASTRSRVGHSSSSRSPGQWRLRLKPCRACRRYGPRAETHPLTRSRRGCSQAPKTASAPPPPSLPGSLSSSKHAARRWRCRHCRRCRSRRIRRLQPSTFWQESRVIWSWHP